MVLICRWISIATYEVKIIAKHDAVTKSMQNLVYCPIAVQFPLDLHTFLFLDY